VVYTLERYGRTTQANARNICRDGLSDKFKLFTHCSTKLIAFDHEAASDGRYIAKIPAVFVLAE
jgi:hypothetical protein